MDNQKTNKNLVIPILMAPVDHVGSIGKEELFNISVFDNLMPLESNLLE